MLEQVFGTQGNVSLWQECARAVVVFAYGLLLIRLAGRRVFGKWAALDFIVSVIAGSSLSRAMTGNSELFATLAATTLLLALHWVLARAAAWSPRLSHLLEGPPLTIGEGGRIDSRKLFRHSISEADLKEALRAAGLEETEAARKVVLEPSGKISVLKE